MAIAPVRADSVQVKHCAPEDERNHCHNLIAAFDDTIFKVSRLTHLLVVLGNSEEANNGVIGDAIHE